MTKMRVYKSIYRLDFPVSFAFLDSIGEHADALRIRVETKPFSSRVTNVNLGEHKIITQLVNDDEKAQLTLNVTTFDGVLEYAKGMEFGEAYRHPVIALATEFLKGLPTGMTSTVIRVGVRHWILVEHDKFKFDALANSLSERVAPMKAGVLASFSSIDDAAITLEASNPSDGTQTRVSMGPYKKEEQGRYFTSDISVEQALMVDMDIWQSKLEIPSFSLQSFGKNFERSGKRVVDSVVERLLKDLS